MKIFKHIKKSILWTVLVAFTVTSVYQERAHADVQLLPAAGQSLSLSNKFAPVLMRGIKVYKDNPFKFDFFIDTGDQNLSPTDPKTKEFGNKLIGYFLASLTIPEKDMWVNLSPYEKEKIIPDNFGLTQMGRDLLAQDFLLKQLTASVLNPEERIGKDFWRKVYAASYRKFGTSKIEINTFNKVWIVPDKAVVFENPENNTVMVLKSSLKVLLEEDYLSMKKNLDAKDNIAEATESSRMSKRIIQEVVLPALQDEVNNGTHFAQLRQVYNSLILASWFKKRLKESILAKGYVNKSKTSGSIEVDDKNIHQKIYEQYLESFKKGVYNFVQEEPDPLNLKPVTRRYFSGGVNYLNIADKMMAVKGPDAAQVAGKTLRNLKMIAISAVMAASVMVGASNTSEAATFTKDPNTGNPIAKVVAKDTVSEIVLDENVRSILKEATGQKGFNVYKDLSENDGLSIRRNGVIVENANLNQIKPGDEVIIRLDAHAQAKAVANGAITPQSAISQTYGMQASLPNQIEDNRSTSPVANQVTQPVSSSPPPPDIRDFENVPPPVNSVNRTVAQGTAPMPPPPAPPVSSSQLDRLMPPLGLVGSNAQDYRGYVPPAVSGSLEQRMAQAVGDSTRGGVPQSSVRIDQRYDGPRPFEEIHSAAVEQHVPELPRLLEQARQGSSVAPNSHLLSQQERLSELARRIQVMTDQDWKSLSRDRGISKRYESMMNRLRSAGANDLEKILVSVERGQEYSIKRELKTKSDVIKFAKSVNPKKTKFFRILERSHGPVEISQLFNPKYFTEVTNPLELEQMTDDSQHYLAYVEGSDEVGDYAGVLMGGIKSAFSKLEYLNNVERHLKLLEQGYQSTSNPTSNANGFIVATFVSRDSDGLIDNNKKSITFGEIKEEQLKLPDGQSRIILKAQIDGRWVVLKPYRFGSPSETIYSLMTPEEEAYLTDPDRYKLALDSDIISDRNPLSRGEIIFGSNWTLVEEMKLRVQREAADKAEKLNDAALEDAKRRQLLQFLLAPVNIAMSIYAPQVPIPVTDIANIIYRFIFKSPVGMLGPPTIEEIKEKELGPWLLERRQQDKQDYMEGRKWDKLTPQEREQIKTEALMMFRTILPEPELQKLINYLEVRQAQGERSQLLEILSGVLSAAGNLLGGLDTHLVLTESRDAQGRLMAYKAPNHKALAFILGKAGWVLTGQLPIPQAIAAAIGGNSAQFVPLNKMGSKAPFLAKISSIGTVAIDLQALVNSFYSNPLEKPFVNAPKEFRFIGNFLGVDVREYLYLFGIQERLEEQIRKKYLDPNVDGFIVKDGWLLSDAIGFSEDQIRGFFSEGATVKIPLSYSTADGQADVPIYLLVDKVTKKKQILVLTKRAIDKRMKVIQKQQENDRQFMERFMNDAVTSVVTSEGGTFNQFLANGLMRSSGGVSGSEANFSFTWDNLQASLVYMLSGHTQISDNTFKFFKARYDADVKKDGKFSGLPSLYTATTGTNISSDIDPGATALYLIQLLNYKDINKSSDPELLKMIDGVANALIANGIKFEKKESLEVAAVVYKALSRAGYKTNADKLLDIAKANLDPDTGLLHHYAASKQLKANATVLWFSVLGSQDTVRLLYGGNQERYKTAWRELFKKFEVSEGVTYGQRKNRYILMDNLDQEGANKRINNSGGRIGDVPLTANTIGRLKEHRALLSSLGENWVDEAISRLSKSLDQLKKDVGGLPASSAPGGDTGFGYPYSSGKSSLASLVEYTFSVPYANPINPFTGNFQEIKNIKVPSEALTQEEQETPTVVSGQAERQRALSLISMLVEIDKIENNIENSQATAWQKKRLEELKRKVGGAKLLEANSNIREAVVVDAKGKVVYKAIHDSKQRVAKSTEVARRELQDTIDYFDATAGKGRFLKGGIVFSTPQQTPDGVASGAPLRIGGKIFQSGELLERFFITLRNMPDVERMRVVTKDSANVRIKMNIGTVAKPNVKEVLATVIFPADKEIIDVLGTENDIDVYLKGKLTLKITPDEVVVPVYNELGVEVSARIFKNPFSYMKRPSNSADLVSKIKQMIKENQLTLIKNSLTLNYKYVNPRLVDALNPSIERTKKLIIEADGTRSIEIFGLHRLYNKKITEKSIEETIRDAFGDIVSAKVFNNRDDDVPILSLDEALERMNNPQKGIQTGEVNAFVGFANVPGVDGKIKVFEFKDIIHGTKKFVLVDTLHGGRKVGESSVDFIPLQNGQKQAIQGYAKYLYDDSFHFGRVPYATLIFNEKTGLLLKIVLTKNYDPSTRTMRGEEYDQIKGSTTGFVLDWRWSSPVQEIVGPRTTTIEHNRNETANRSTTREGTTGEIIKEGNGVFTIPEGWAERSTVYHRHTGDPDSPFNVVKERKTTKRTAGGRDLNVEVNDQVSSTLTYDDNGYPRVNTSFLKDPLTGSFTIPFHTTKTNSWTAGKANQSVDPGTPLGHSQVMDEVGRVESKRKGSEKVAVNETMKYEDGTEREQSTTIDVNGTPRFSISYDREQQDLNSLGRWIVPTTNTPAVFGLKQRAGYPIGDALGRPSGDIINFSDGSVLKITGYVGVTNIPASTITFNSNGLQVKSSTFNGQFTVGPDGSPLMLVQQFTHSFLGTFINTGALSFITDTPIPVSEIDVPKNEITIFNLLLPYQAPFYSSDLSTATNKRIKFPSGEMIDANTVYTSSVVVSDGIVNATTSEPVLNLTAIKFDGTNPQNVTQTTIDSAGNQLVQESGKIISPNKGGLELDTILAEVQKKGNGAYTSRAINVFEPGGFIANGQGGLRFTTDPFEVASLPLPMRVNTDGARHVPTKVEKYRNTNPNGENIAPNSGAPNTFTKSAESRSLEIVPSNPNTTLQKSWWSTMIEVPFVIKSQGAQPTQLPNVSTTVWFDESGTQLNSNNLGKSVKNEELNIQAYSVPPITPQILQKSGARPIAEIASTYESGQLRLEPVKPFAVLLAEGVSDLEIELTDTNGKTVVVSNASNSALKFWQPFDLNKMFITNANDPVTIASIDASRTDMQQKKVWVISIPQLSQIIYEDETNVDLSKRFDTQNPIKVRLKYKTDSSNAQITPFIMTGDVKLTQSTKAEFTKVENVLWNEGSVTIKVSDPAGRINSRTDIIAKATQTLGNSSEKFVPSKTTLAGYLSKDEQKPVSTVPASLTSPEVQAVFWDPTGKEISELIITFIAPDGSSYVIRVDVGSSTKKPTINKFEADKTRGEPTYTAFGTPGNMLVFRNGVNILSANMGSSKINEIVDQFLKKKDDRLGLSPEVGEFILKLTRAGEIAKIIKNIPLANEAAVVERPFWQEYPDVVNPQVHNVGDSKAALQKYFNEEMQAIKSGDQKLIRTLFGTYENGNIKTSDFVDTSDELERVVPALVRMGRVSDAEKVLRFYIDKSERGKKTIADSYHYKMGIAITFDPYVQNTNSSAYSAHSQVSFVNALLILGKASQNSLYYQIAEEAFDQLIIKHNPSLRNLSQLNKGSSVLSYLEHALNFKGGITEAKSNDLPFDSLLKLPVETIKQKPDQYLTRTNTNFYETLSKIIKEVPNGNFTKKAILFEKLQREWFEQNGLFERLKKDFQQGLMPDSFHEVSDAAAVRANELRGLRVLTDNPWATFSSSTSIMRVAHAAGVLTSQELKELLANVSRYYQHRVTVEGKKFVGFESVARSIGRDAVVLPANMSEFIYLAKLAKDAELVQRLMSELRGYPRVNGFLPEIIYNALPAPIEKNGFGLDAGVKDGSGGQKRYMPSKDNKTWPGSINTTIEDFFSIEGYSPYSVSPDRAMLIDFIVSSYSTVMGIVSGFSPAQIALLLTMVFYQGLQVLAYVVPASIYKRNRKKAYEQYKGIHSSRQLFEEKLRSAYEARLHKKVFMVIDKDTQHEVAARALPGVGSFAELSDEVDALTSYEQYLRFRFEKENEEKIKGLKKLKVDKQNELANSDLEEQEREGKSREIEHDYETQYNILFEAFKEKEEKSDKKHLEHTVRTEYHIEGAFIAYIRVIGLLAAERVRLLEHKGEGDWDLNSPGFEKKIIEEDKYLGAVDDLFIMLSAYLRQEFAKGENVQVLNQIDAYLQFIVVRLMDALNEGDAKKFDSIMHEITQNFGKDHPQEGEFRKKIADPKYAGQEAITYKYVDYIPNAKLKMERFNADFYKNYVAFNKAERIVSIPAAKHDYITNLDLLLFGSLMAIFTMANFSNQDNPFTALLLSFSQTMGSASLPFMSGTGLMLLAAITLQIKAQFNAARMEANKARWLGAGLLFAAGVLGYTVPVFYSTMMLLKWLIVSLLAIEGISLLQHKWISYAYALAKDIKSFIPNASHRLFQYIFRGENKRAWVSYKFSKNDFKESQDLLKVLVNNIAKDVSGLIGEKYQEINDIELDTHTSWINDSIYPYKILQDRIKINQLKGIDPELRKILPDNFVDFPEFRLTSLSKTSRGQEIKRRLLIWLYPKVTPSVKQTSPLKALFPEFNSARGDKSEPSSMLGLTLYFNLKPALVPGPWYTWASYFLTFWLTIGFVMLSANDYNLNEWFKNHFAPTTEFNFMLGAMNYVAMAIYLMSYSIFGWVGFGISILRHLHIAAKLKYYRMRGITLNDRILADLSQVRSELVDNMKKIGIMQYGGVTIVSPAIQSGNPKSATEALIRGMRVLRANGDKSADIMISDEEARSILNALHEAEVENKTSLFHWIQINSEVLAAQGYSFKVDKNAIDEKTKERRVDLIYRGLGLRLYLSKLGVGTANMDVAANLISKAIQMKMYGLGEQAVFYIGHNKYVKEIGTDNPSLIWEDNKEIQQRNYLAGLIKAISGNAEVQYVQTHFGQKSAGMNSMFLSKEFRRLRYLFVEDRNATTHDLQRWMIDAFKIVKDENLAIVVANRDTTYHYNEVGKASFLVEQGFIAAGPQKVSTGWGTMQKMLYEDNITLHSYFDAQIKPLTGATAKYQRNVQKFGFMQRAYNNTIGAVLIAPNSPGQSEDYQSLLALAYTMESFGMNPEYAQSEAFWTKLRESHNMGPWTAAPVRWSAGRLQTIEDYFMQNLNDFGPESVFARKYNINQGRFYTTMPLAEWTIKFAPLVVVFDWTSFSGIQLMFFGFGLLASHVAVSYGVIASLKKYGFNNLMAVLGGLSTGAFVYWGLKASIGVAIWMGALGFIASGFGVGLAVWLSRFFVDKLLFAKRIHTETGGQYRGHKGITFQFEMSSTKGDNPYNPYAFLTYFFSARARKIKIFTMIEDVPVPIERLRNIESIKGTVLDPDHPQSLWKETETEGYVVLQDKPIDYLKAGNKKLTSSIQINGLDVSFESEVDFNKVAALVEDAKGKVKSKVDSIDDNARWVNAVLGESVKIPRSRFEEINGIKDTILDPNHQDSVWQEAEDGYVVLKDNQKIIFNTGFQGAINNIRFNSQDDFDEMVALLEETQAGQHVRDISSINDSIRSGVYQTLFNLFVMQKLDFMNWIMLLPSLYFTMSKAVGAFMMKRKLGKETHWSSLVVFIGFLAGAIFGIGLNKSGILLGGFGSKEAMDYYLIFAGFTLAVIVNWFPVVRILWGIKNYPYIPENEINPSLLSQSMNVRKYINIELKKNPLSQRTAVRKGLDVARHFGSLNPVILKEVLANDDAFERLMALKNDKDSKEIFESESDHLVRFDGRILFIKQQEEKVRAIAGDKFDRLWRILKSSLHAQDTSHLVWYKNFDWLFNGKWARITSQLARGFWSAVMFMLFPIFVPSITSYDFLYQDVVVFVESQVVDFHLVPYAASAIAVYVLFFKYFVRLTEKWWLQKKINALKSRIRLIFKDNETQKDYSFRRHLIDPLKIDLDQFMVNEQFGLVKQVLRDVEEQLRNGNKKPVLPSDQQSTASSNKDGEDKALKVDLGKDLFKNLQSKSSESPANAIAESIGMTPGAFIKKPGGIDLSLTNVESDSTGSMIKNIFDDQQILEVLMESQGLTPIIYEIKSVSPGILETTIGISR